MRGGALLFCRTMSTIAAAAGRIVGTAPTTRPELLSRAKSYPFERPKCSFIYANGNVLPFSPSDWASLCGEKLGVASTDRAVPALPRLGELPVHAEGGAIGRLDEQLESAGIPKGLLAPEGG